MEEPEAPDSPADESSGPVIGEDGQNKKDPDAIRKQVCAEILNTERSFVRDLEVMQVRPAAALTLPRLLVGPWAFSDLTPHLAALPFAELCLCASATWDSLP